MPKTRRISSDRKNGTSLAFDHAKSAFDRAEYSQCLNLLAIVPGNDGETALLRARCTRFLADDESSHAAALIASRDGDTVGDRLAGAALQLLAAQRLSKQAEVRRLVSAISAELAMLPVRDVEEARALFALALSLEGDTAGARTLLDGNVRSGAPGAQTLMLLGALEMAQGRYPEAGTTFGKALRKLNASGGEDVRSAAVVVSALATIAAETVDLELAKRVRTAYEKMTWPASLASEHFMALSALRMLALIEGDVSGAYFRAREAAGIAPGPAMQAIAETQLAAISRILGDLGSEKLQLRRAWDIAKGTKGAQSDPSLPFALVNFAAEAASLMPAEARKAMTSYRALVNESSASDTYLEAFASGAAARVSEGAGDRVAAVKSARAALAAWQRLGIDLRVATTAVDARRLTGDESYAKLARSVTSRIPKAWFAAELKRGKSPVFALTPAERVVLARLLRGESAKAIGEALERSPFTISNHTRKIFAAFDLNSRSKVIARCVELGITPESIERDS